MDIANMATEARIAAIVGVLFGGVILLIASKADKRREKKRNQLKKLIIARRFRRFTLLKEE